MKKLLIIAITMFSVSCFAENSTSQENKPDERAVIETAKRTMLDVEFVRKSAIADCDGTQLEVNVCAEYHYVVEDLGMSDVYAQAIAKVRSKPAEMLLRKSQRAWLTYRDATCNYESSGVDGGTAQGYYMFSCLKKLTVERISHLVEYVQCDQADCPGGN